jgi:hypothetical protein
MIASLGGGVASDGIRIRKAVIVMSAAEAIAAILSGTVSTLVALAGLVWWAYKLGEAAGASKAERGEGQRSQAANEARILDLEQEIVKMRAQLAAVLATTQSRRRRILGLHVNASDASAA